VEPTLLIFAETFRFRPDLAPGRRARQLHRLPWLHRAVPSATLDERRSRLRQTQLIRAGAGSVKSFLNRCRRDQVRSALRFPLRDGLEPMVIGPRSRFAEPVGTARRPRIMRPSRSLSLSLLGACPYESLGEPSEPVPDVPWIPPPRPEPIRHQASTRPGVPASRPPAPAPPDDRIPHLRSAIGKHRIARACPSLC
jgi:hypothetical protein